MSGNEKVQFNVIWFVVNSYLIIANLYLTKRGWKTMKKNGVYGMRIIYGRN